MKRGHCGFPAFDEDTSPILVLNQGLASAGAEEESTEERKKESLKGFSGGRVFGEETPTTRTQSSEKGELKA